ncbi:hypothetical protein COX64_02435, partial [Candidatus Dojkabacteria bacterium CG_4_10_14_0_2_um_filter_Dojkabacteria_WS6_41_15]
MNDIEKTLVIIKNDAIKRSLVGKILQKFEEAGLKIIEMKMTIPTEAEAKAHYNMGNNLKWLTGVGMKAKSMYSSEKAIAKRFNSTNAATIGKAVYHWSVLQLQNKLPRAYAHVTSSQAVLRTAGYYIATLRAP